MIDYSTYKVSIKNNEIFFIDDLERFNVTLLDMMKLCPFFKEISETFEVSMEYLHNLVTEVFHIPMRDLFEVSIYGSNALMLIEEKHCYTEKTIRFNQVIKTYYNAYLRENQYIGLKFEKFAMQIFKEKYSDFFTDNFYFNEYRRKYPKELKIYDYMKVEDFIHLNRFKCEINNLTLGDVVHLLTDENAKNEMIFKSCFRFYDKSKQFYLKLGKVKVQEREYEYSFVIPYTFLKTKNWSEIENIKVYSIIKPNANEKLGEDKNNWFSGKQKDSPYWEKYLPIIEKFKEIMMK